MSTFNAAVASSTTRAFADRVTAKLRRRRRVPDAAHTSFDRDSFASAFPVSPALRQSPATSAFSTLSLSCPVTPCGAEKPSQHRIRKRSLVSGSCAVRVATETRSSTTSTVSSTTTTTTSSTTPSSKSKMHLKLAGSTASSTSSSSPRPVAVPHTITEGHGGKELWVTAPMLGGEMEKQGFRWRKKWKLRYVELNSRMLSYYEVLPSSASDHHSQHARKARRRAHITADAVLEDMDACSFAITPSATEKPWVFRARDARTKLQWCKALTDCIDILVWLRHYELGDLLGVGGNGVVHAITDTRDGRQFAVKSIDVAKFRNRAAVVSEVEIMRQITNEIKHPNLVTIHKVYEEQDKIHLTLDLCDGGELYDSIVKRGCYSERGAARTMRQLMSAVQALHAYNILHLDIKPENILFASKAADAKIVLTDFGLARMVNGKANPLETGRSMAGTVGYIAPEVVSAHAYSPAADVFSAGVILFILLVGYPPFRGDSEVEILLKTARGDFVFDRADWANISPLAKELVAQMLTVRADERISVDDVLRHPWLTEEAADRELAQTMQRLQRFNFDRKSENMGSFMGTMLNDANEAEYKALVDPKTIGLMIRQLSPEGKDRIPLARAHVLAKGLGLSPFIDEKTFVRFLDQDHDGFINADDFCGGVKAVRNSDAPFTTIIFGAMLKVAGRDADRATPTATKLTRADFVTALEKLQCPEPLVQFFFKAVDKQHRLPSPLEDDDDSNNSNDCNDSSPVDWEVNETEFVELSAQHPFIWKLFLRTAKDNLMYVKSRSMDIFPQILEDYSSDSPVSTLG